MIEAKELASRYAAVWNEPDTDLRRKAISAIWSEDAVHHLQPPAEVVETAAKLGVTVSFEARGHDGLEDRVTRSYEEFVAPGENHFRARGDAARIGNVVEFHWEYVSTSTGEVLGGGLEVVHVDADDRIVADYQFPG